MGTPTAGAHDHGHGTFSAACAVGAALHANASIRRAARFDGAAPAAKLAFYDLRKAAAPPSALKSLLGSFGLGRGFESVPGWTYPLDAHEKLFPPGYAAGARIHSISWGSPDNGYTRLARNIDRFVYEHPDFLVVVAAGNDGKGARERRAIPPPARTRSLSARRSTPPTRCHRAAPLAAELPERHAGSFAKEIGDAASPARPAPPSCDEERVVALLGPRARWRRQD